MLIFKCFMSYPYVYKWIPLIFEIYDIELSFCWVCGHVDDWISLNCIYVDGSVHVAKLISGHALNMKKGMQV